MKVTVVGLGKLGACLAAVLAEAGHEVIGVDKNQVTVTDINNGRAPVKETGLQELIGSLQPGSLTATTKYSKAIPKSEISMIVVPTPSGPDGCFLNDYVIQAVRDIGSNLGKAWHTVVVCSTVMPGAMSEYIQPALERAAGRPVGQNLGLAFSPEFIALGSVVRDMKHPDAVFIGAEDNLSTRHTRNVIESYVCSRPTFHEMSFAEAELAKIGVNAFVTMKISYANTIAEMCEHLKGTSAVNVLRAIGSDSRIGTSYLKSGASYSGECFPRDSIAFASLGEKLESQAYLAEAATKVNNRIAERIANDLIDFDSVAILGLSFKPNTPVSTESLGLKLTSILRDVGKEVRVHDPMATPQLPTDVIQYPTVEEAIETAKVVVVATPWDAYRNVYFGGRCILDVWGCTLDQENRRVTGDYCWWWSQ